MNHTHKAMLDGTPPGYRTRINHCKTDSSLLLRNTGKYYTAKCFRCGLDEYEPIGRLSLAQLSKQSKTAMELKRSRSMPGGCEPVEASTGALQYLLKFGIDNTLADTYGVRYHPGMNRVVFPAGSDWWLARSFTGERPKWLAPAVPKAGRVVKSRDYDGRGTVVVVEDYLSLIKVGRSYGCVSALGTAISTELLSALANAERVIVWMDDDAAGSKASTDILDSLNLMGVPGEILSSPCDPKYYDKSEIVEFIESLE